MVMSPPCPRCGAGERDPAPDRCTRCALPLLLAGKYRLASILSQGEDRASYLARHEGMEEDAERIIRVMPPEILARPGSAERFREEMELASALSRENPHLIR